MTSSGATTHAGLARLLPFDRPGYGPQRVARWLKGQARPNYEQTVALLEIAGWLSADQAEHTGRLATLEAEVAQIQEERATLLQEVVARLAALEANQAAATHPEAQPSTARKPSR